MATQTDHSLHEQSEGFKSLPTVPRKPTDFCEKCQREDKLYSVKGRTAEGFYQCRHQVYWGAGTMMKKTTTPYEIWCIAYQIIEDFPDIPIQNLARHLKISWVTARRIKQLILEDEDQAIILFGGR